MLSENNIPGTWLTALHTSHRSKKGTSPNFGWKRRGICAKVALAIQNQRYLWNEAV